MLRRISYLIVASYVAPHSVLIASGEPPKPHLIEIPASGNASEPSKPAGARWAATPSKDQFHMAAPSELKSTGMTVIKCRVKSDNTLQNCASDPKLRGNERVDAAALSLVSYFRVASPSHAGSEIVFLVAFQPASRTYNPCLPPYCIPVLKPPTFTPR